MRNKNSKSFLAGILAVLMMISLMSGLALALSSESNAAGYKIVQMGEVTARTNKGNYTHMEESEEKTTDPNEIVTIIVALEDDPVLETYGTLSALQSGARTLSSKGKNLEEALLAKQAGIAREISNKLLDGKKVEVRSNFTLIFNGFSFDGPFHLIEKIKGIEGVKFCEPSMMFEVPKTKFNNNLKPAMYAAADMVTAFGAWDLGYKGEGILVAVVDTGLYTDHEAFQTAPENQKISLEALQEIFEKNVLQAENRVPGLTAEDCYLREKVPFTFDYAHNDYDANHGHSANSSDHGTHVAGISVADPQNEMNGLEGVYARGVAPKAQLAVMKVFPDQGGGAAWDNTISALEDCIYIGADVANLSLGSPLGFPTQGQSYAKIYDILKDNGVSLSVAAGNDFSSGYSNSWGKNMNTTLNPDSSMVGSPSTYADSLSVAAINNTHKYYTDYIKIGGKAMGYTDTAESQGKNPDMLYKVALGGKTYEVVPVPGLGEEADYEGIDVAGKIALIQRGTINFEAKHLNAYNNGAVACIIYDNVFSNNLINMVIAEFKIPAIFISRANGLFIIECVEKGDNQLFISNGKPVITDNVAPAEPTDFSSWGPLANLTIKPEIAAPGGAIMSTVDPLLTGKEGGMLYGEMSGTSMAAPSITGCMAIVRQYVDERFPSLSLLDKVNMVNSLLMSTADPTVNTIDGASYAVRKQGAGMADILGAISTNAVLTVDGNVRPKLEIGEDADRTGIYTLKFNVKNFGDAPLTYVIEPELTTSGYEWVDQGDRATYVMTPHNIALNDMMTYTTNHTNNTVTVAPGETQKIEVVITVNQEFRDMMAEVFPYGGYVEGYCYLRGQGDDEGSAPTDLNICYLGFYGSWSEVPVVDSGFYYDKPEDDLSSLLYPNTAAAKFATGVYYEIGMNPYFEDAEEFEFLGDRGSISPANADNLLDEVDTVYTGVMRNLKQFYYMVIDKETGEVLWDKTINGAIQKNADTSGQGFINPTGVTGTKIKAWEGEGTEEGSTVIIRTGGKAYYDKWDDSKAPMAYWEFPVTLDNTVPHVVDSWATGSKVTAKISDNHYVAYAGVFALDNLEEPMQTFCIAENERKAVSTIEFDMNGKDSVFLVLADYAGNEVQFQVFENGAIFSPLPSPPETDETYYAPVYDVEYGETFIITTTGEFTGTPDTVYALTGVAAQPYGIRLQGATVEVTDSYITGGAKFAGMEWKLNEDGTIQNVLTGAYLGLVEHGSSFWLGTTSSKDVKWAFDGKYLSHNSDKTSDTHLIYYPTIENSDIAAFDIFNPSQSASKISLYKKVTQQRQVDATMTTTVREDGDKIFVDIDISKDSGAASGMITLSYSSEMLTYDSATPGSALNGFLVQTNGSVPGKIASAFAGSEIIPDAGGTMITYQFTKSAKAITGTLLVFDLVCNELIDTDTVTLLKVEAVGASYVVGGGEPTPPPTTPPPTTPPPTTPPPTTAPPTTPPADARILRTEFVSEVDNVVKVQVTISADSSAASGMYTLVYDPSIFTFKSHTQGAALSGFLVIANSENDGEVVVAFAGSEMIPNAGGVLGTFELTIKDGVAKGTKTLIDLICNELIHDDTTTLLEAVTYGLNYTIGGEDPTPTTPPPTTAPPTTPPPTTAPPTTPPPTTAPPTTPPPTTEPPTTPPATTVPPTTEPPVTEPPTTEPPTSEPPATEDPDPPVTGSASVPYFAVALALLGVCGVAYYYATRREEA